MTGYRSSPETCIGTDIGQMVAFVERGQARRGWGLHVIDGSPMIGNSLVAPVGLLMWVEPFVVADKGDAGGGQRLGWASRKSGKQLPPSISIAADAVLSSRIFGLGQQIVAAAAFSCIRWVLVVPGIGTIQGCWAKSDANAPPVPGDRLVRAGSGG